MSRFIRVRGGEGPTNADNEIFIYTSVKFDSKTGKWTGTATRIKASQIRAGNCIQEYRGKMIYIRLLLYMELQRKEIN